MDATYNQIAAIMPLLEVCGVVQEDVVLNVGLSFSALWCTVMGLIGAPSERDPSSPKEPKRPQIGSK